MTPEERERLADAIAAELRRTGAASGRADGDRGPWLPTPVRPAPPPRQSEPPPWSGAAQSLGDVAPVRRPVASDYRADAGATAAAVRGAAAGKGAPRAADASRRAVTGSESLRVRGTATGRGRSALGVEVSIGISRRHLHLSAAHAAQLFGASELEPAREIRQPGQFAARQQVDVVGPRGRIERVRVVGPARAHTQLELARSDATVLGIDPPIAASGAHVELADAVTLVGPIGQVVLRQGVIVAARHLHLSPEDSARWNLRDGDRVDVRCGEEARAVTWHDVLVRSGPAHASELHLDEDEARAAAVAGGDIARIVAHAPAVAAPRPLVTEHVVNQLARRGEAIPANALVTPAARDRARALGLDLS